MLKHPDPFQFPSNIIVTSAAGAALAFLQEMSLLAHCCILTSAGHKKAGDIDYDLCYDRILSGAL